MATTKAKVATPKAKVAVKAVTPMKPRAIYKGGKKC